MSVLSSAEKQSIMPKAIVRTIAWIAVALVGAGSLAVVATSRGEQISAVWMLVASVGCYLVAYRFYSRFIANKVVGLDNAKPTPAVTQADGLDYVPTNRYVLFGHHFAAIAGAGPLVGPVLAAQLGYLPGTLWIIVGAILCGCVQDFIILVMSARRGARSLGEMIREEMGPLAGVTAQIGVFAIMIIILAVLALIIVKALTHSPWGTFTVAATIPIAMLMGLYSRFIRPDHIVEVSVIGIVLMLAAVAFGQQVANTPALARIFDLTDIQICWVLIVYGLVASIFPVWLLLAPRGYLSTFLKIGVILLLAAGIVVTHPMLLMPAVTRFAAGGGPVWAGTLFPFLFITIACGAVSGFHAIISSGTTPKLLANETDARLVGYGSMLMESFVAIMALVSACVLQPSIYFTMNSPAAVVGATSASAAHAVSAMGFSTTPEAIDAVAHSVGEKTVISRTGGAPTLAVGIAKISADVIGQGALGYLYHFAILFEALFILTAVDSGTRAVRFMLQDLIGMAVPSFRKTSALVPNMVATAICVGAWGYFLYQGTTDPMGGVNTLWPIFALSNQMLGGLALSFATVVLINRGRARYAWVTLAPTAWITLCTFTAAGLKIFSSDPAVGFLRQAHIFQAAAANGQILAPAKTMAQMNKIISNDLTDASLCAFFVLVTLIVFGAGIRSALKDRASKPALVDDPAWAPVV
jgi:carbon starvation protein